MDWLMTMRIDLLIDWNDDDIGPMGGAYLFIRLFVYSFIHSFVRLFVCSFNRLIVWFWRNLASSLLWYVPIIITETYWNYNKQVVQHNGRTDGRTVFGWVMFDPPNKRSQRTASSHERLIDWLIDWWTKSTDSWCCDQQRPSSLITRLFPQFLSRRHKFRPRTFWYPLLGLMSIDGLRQLIRPRINENKQVVKNIRNLDDTSFLGLGLGFP